MDTEELAQYIELTRSIVQKLGGCKDDHELGKYAQILLFHRANIVKNSSAKHLALDEILNGLPEPVTGTIIYCTPQQIDRVMETLNRRRLVAHRFTMHQDSTPSSKYHGLSERDYILDKFAKGEYQVLAAMKCLDEGVDIPQATTAIIMASSGNPREYIQRIGRVLRRWPGKDIATIHDLVVAPSLGRLPPELRKIEIKIFDKELERYKELAAIAVNNAEALEIISEIRRKYMETKYVRH